MSSEDKAESSTDQAIAAEIGTNRQSMTTPVMDSAASENQCSDELESTPTTPQADTRETSADEVLDRTAILSERIDRISHEHAKGFEMMDNFTKVLDEMATSTTLDDENEKLKSYLSELGDGKQRMGKAMSRIQNIQLRLNKIRMSYPAHSKAMVQQGPFYYKCVWQGGIRYREYPKSDAKVIEGKMVSFNEIVEIDERVYIAGENLVYLHQKGSGWLFENKDGITALKRVPFASHHITASSEGDTVDNNDGGKDGGQLEQQAANDDNEKEGVESTENESGSADEKEGVESSENESPKQIITQEVIDGQLQDVVTSEHSMEV